MELQFKVVQMQIKGQQYLFSEGSKTKEAKAIAIQRAQIQELKLIIRNLKEENKIISR